MIAQPERSPPPSLKVHLENLSDREAREWVEVGLPASMSDESYPVSGTIPGGRVEGWVHGGLMFLRATLPPLAKVTCEVSRVGTDDPEGLRPMHYSDWVTDQPLRLPPRFVVVMADGTRVETPAAVPTLVELGPCRHTWKIQQMLPGPIAMESWWHVYDGQDHINFEIRLSSSTTTSNSGLRQTYRGISMLVGEKPTIDWRVRKGLHEPMYRTDIVPGQVWWEAELFAGGTMLRTQTLEIQGSLLCLPPEDRFGQVAGTDRVGYLRSREVAPIRGILDSRHWQGEWARSARCRSRSPAQTPSRVAARARSSLAIGRLPTRSSLARMRSRRRLGPPANSRTSARSAASTPSA